MSHINKYREFLLCLNEVSGKNWDITPDGIMIDQITLVFCPETINFSCFFREELNQIFLTKEIFPEFEAYFNCQYFKKVVLINFSSLFDLSEGVSIADNDIKECNLTDCSFSGLIKSVVKIYNHRNEKFNSICPENKNIIIHEQLDQRGLNCSFLMSNLLNQYLTI